jgi:hypothetical protein
MADSKDYRRVLFEWVEPVRTTQDASILVDEGKPVSKQLGGESVVDYLRTYGFLTSVGANTPKEELLALLSVAAEVEHALLVQYLYAAASIPSGLGSEIIQHIAIQEMAHLLTIQNLLLAVGGPTTFHIGRDVARTNSAFNPLPFDLEPISKLALAEFVLVERPLKIPSEHRDKVLELEQLVAAKTNHRPVRVGALYAKIYWLLQPGDESFGRLSLTPDPSIGFDPGWHVKATDFTPSNVVILHQGEANEWRSSSGPDMRIHLVANAKTAVDAVYSVMEQGEGPVHAGGSHFDNFLKILKYFEEGRVQVVPLPTNPYVGQLPPEQSAGTQLQSNYVRLWANLLNVRYSALMLSVGQAMLTPRDDLNRERLITFIFNVLMGRNLGGLIRHMTSTTLLTIDRNSAPTFELLREDMPSNLQECWNYQSQFLNIEKQIREELQQNPELANDIEGTNLLNDLESTWRELRDFVDAHL